MLRCDGCGRIELMIDDIRPQPERRSQDGSEDEHEPEKTNNQEDQAEATKPSEYITVNSSKIDSLVDDSAGSTPSHPIAETKKPKIRKFLSKKIELWPSSKRQQIIGAVLSLVIIFVGSGSIFALNGYFDKLFVTPEALELNFKPKTFEYSKLTGVEVPIGTNKKLVVSVQIENSPDARPQSGLVDAGVVYEAIAEGGITRFNASFLEKKPGYLGPIRSVRPYYAGLAAPFDPVFVHAGGSGAGLQKLKKLHIKDFDHGANAAYFQRVSDRFAPHNLYSSIDNILKGSKGRGYKTSNTKSFLRKKKETPADKITAKSIDLSISGPLYDVNYDYNSKSNSYDRTMAGRPHKDQKSGKRISPKVVIALVMNYHKSGIYSVYKYTGSGKAFIFQDGQVLKGTWKKKADKVQFTFTGKDKKPIELNPGQIWFTLVDSPGSVKFRK